MKGGGGGGSGSKGGDGGGKADECVKVVVRIRPLSDKETGDGRKPVVRAIAERAEVVVESVASATEPPKTFTFDATFGAESKQEQIYDSAAYPIIESVLKGFNGTILAVRLACAPSRLPAAAVQKKSSAADLSLPRFSLLAPFFLSLSP